MEIHVHFVLLGLVCLSIVLDIVGSAEGSFLVAYYPDIIIHDRSYVNLTCVGLNEAQRPATFLRNGSEITADSVVFVTGETNISISFVFNQSQEGVFTCRTRDGSVSNAVELAACPCIKSCYCQPVIKDRYFLIPSADTPIDLACGIQPGALVSKYRADWDPEGVGFNISPVVSPDEPRIFFCRVFVTHMTGDDESFYSGGSVRVHTKVLSTWADIHVLDSVSVAFGEPANLSCALIVGDTDFQIIWRIGNSEYHCDENKILYGSINCKIVGNISLLQIEDSSFLGAGSHVVQCILHTINIHPNYTNDPSFLHRLSDNIMKTIILMINSTKNQEKSTNYAIAGAAALAVGPVVVCGVVAVFLWRRQSQKRRGHSFVEFRELETPSPPSPVDLVHQLQKELGRRNRLYLKHHLQLNKVIGEGESGLVYRGYINSGELVAVKTSKALLSACNKDRLLKEVSMMISFDHPNVMSLIGMCFDGEVPLLIMPFMSGGSVLDYATQNRENLHFIDGTLKGEVSNARKKCLDMCHQIAKGMSYLAMKRFVHRDLAARNCLIDALKGGLVKVSDFGLAEDMYGYNYYEHEGRQERVPVRWMAPESMETNIYNEATDVWSFGVTCWEVFTCGRVPYTGVPAMTLLSELQSGHRLDRPNNITCSDKMWEMMGLCWKADPQQRPKFSDLACKLFDLLDSESTYLRLL